MQEKPSTLAENDVSLRCVSDAERGALAARHSAELSERIDMFDETGLTASDAKKLPIVIPASTRRWFSSNAVHALEKEQLETWFFGKRIASPATLTVRRVLKGGLAGRRTIPGKVFPANMPLKSTLMFWRQVMKIMKRVLFSNSIV